MESCLMIESDADENDEVMNGSGSHRWWNGGGMGVFHHPCHQDGPYVQRCSLGRSLLIGFWLIYVWIPVYMLWRCLSSGEGKNNSCLQCRIPH